ncbi:hypothetical protein OMP43_03100 [Sphingomonas sp. CBMAI 2297]|uniref:tetratricopeptide repeat protein n=1 Tax=Sphingomonas sp. CBMAI 2297 TaxID=2991720 RepID=UPI002457A46B|nr:hypothetical protein [Sphingomonas sp. CBMAI 2297]MDH4743001.1 hypothetical protein [Sphingomonas sp. CBMAI 2297]
MFVVVPLALLMALLAGAVSLSCGFSAKAPQLAVRLWPWNSISVSTLGAKAFLRQDYDSAGALSLDALRVEPANVIAIRTRGLAIEGQGKQADQLMHLAERLSRRDLFTNLWLIEDASRRGDIPKALYYYDITLRTSSQSPQLLFPILAGAISDPDILRVAYPMFAKRPPWLVPFLEYTASAGTADPALVDIVGRLARMPEALPLQIRRFVVQKLAERGKLDSALALYREWSGAMELSGGELDRSGQWPPFDWSFIDGAGFGASANSGGGLSYYGGSSGGKVAERLLHMTPGAAELVSVTSYVERPAGEGARWMVSCASGQPLGAIALGTVAKDRLRFTVPDTEGCRYQFLTLFLSGMDTADTSYSGQVRGIEVHHLAAQ